MNTVNLNSNHYDVVSLTCTGKEEHLSQCDSSRGTNNEILSVTCQQKCKSFTAKLLMKGLFKGIKRLSDIFLGPECSVTYSKDNMACMSPRCP